MKASRQQQNESGIQMPRELIPHRSLPTTFIIILVMFSDKTSILKMDSPSLLSPSLYVCVCVCTCTHMLLSLLLLLLCLQIVAFVLSANKPEAQNHRNSISTKICKCKTNEGEESLETFLLANPNRKLICQSLAFTAVSNN